MLYYYASFSIILTFINMYFQQLKHEKNRELSQRNI